MMPYKQGKVVPDSQEWLSLWDSVLSYIPRVGMILEVSLKDLTVESMDISSSCLVIITIFNSGIMQHLKLADGDNSFELQLKGFFVSLY